MKEDKIEIEILPDGSFKITTDKVSMANHTNAEGLLRALCDGAGGLVKRARRYLMGNSLKQALDAHASDGHTHDHEHGGEHHHH